MGNQKNTEILKVFAGEFKTAHLDDPAKCGLTKEEKLWMEELSKVYLCIELGIDVPKTSDEVFLEKIRTITAFGHDSTLITRLITFAADIISAADFTQNASSCLTTLNTHESHWAQKHLEAHHAYLIKRPVEDFMEAYFDAPDSIPNEELTYFLTFYFKHFYRLLYQFMLFYTKSEPIYYGRAHP
jgi:hypothetical protein